MLDTSISRSPVSANDVKAWHLRIINDLEVALIGVTDINKILWTIAKTAIADLGFDDCVIYLMDKSGRNLIQRAAHGGKNPAATEILNPIVIALGKGVVGSVAAHGEAIVISDTREHEEYIVDDEARLSELAVPIIYDNRVIGVIDSEHPESNFYTRQDLDCLTTMASITANKIANAVLIEELETTVTQLKRTQTELEQSRDQIAFFASHDFLTGLKNRREFEIYIDRILKTKIHQTRPILCIIDLDQFKLINDRCGHAAGDQLLVELSSLFFTQIEAKFIAVAARIGGDEFALLFEKMTLEEVLSVCNKLIEKTNRYKFQHTVHTFTINLSIGVLELDDTYSTTQAALSAADSACYVAKQTGRNRIHVYSNQDKHYSEEAVWASEILHAVNTNQLCLYAQPINCSINNQPMYYEILVRYIKGSHVINATTFINAIERYGVISKLDRWVVNETLKWLSQNDWPFTMFINLSAETIKDLSFTFGLKNALDKFDIDPRRLGFEITETKAIANLLQAKELVRLLQEMGCKVALDDFGSGYSSFEYLKGLDVNIIKFDGMFVRDIGSDFDYMFLENMNEIAHKMNVQTVAESVETKKIYDEVKRIGIDYAQGYYLARPQALDTIILSS